MIEISVEILAAPELFSSSKAILYSFEGLLAIVALVIGTVATIGKQGKEGAGSGITNQFGVIVLSVLIFLSASIAALITHGFSGYRVTPPAQVPNPWGQ